MSRTERSSKRYSSINEVKLSIRRQRMTAMDNWGCVEGMVAINIQIIIVEIVISQMSAEKVSQQLFMKVKQQLDYHRLPTSFPIEATHLLAKVLALIGSESSPAPHSSIPIAGGESLSTALKHEMAKVVKENNKLHMDMICLQQQNQSLQHAFHKLHSNKHSDLKELEKLSFLKSQREQELVEELKEVKFKYNELMDFLHEDPAAEREYIKRLMKHKQMKGAYLDQEEEQQHGNKSHLRDSNPSHSKDRLRQLERKIANREKEITRLHSLIEYDGINMNKIIKNFNEDLFKKQLKNADSKINYLEESYHQIKKENSKMKGNNGSKEALRAEVQNCHQIIDRLKKQNKKLLRNQDEQEFNIDKKTSQNDRKVSKINSEKEKYEQLLHSSQHKYHELEKKTHFLEKEVKELKTILVANEDKLNEKEASIEEFVKKNESLKLYYEYELQTYKKKLYELENELEEAKHRTKENHHEFEILKKENHLKTQSIHNLEKIVNELIRKNSILADNTVGTLEQSMRQSGEIEGKRQLIDMQQQLIYAQNEKIQIEVDLKALEHRFGISVRENEKYKQEYGHLKSELGHKEGIIGKLESQIDELRYQLKREQTETARAQSHLKEVAAQKDAIIGDLKVQNQHLHQLEKTIRLKLRDLEIKNSEEEGVWEATRLRLEEKQEKIKHLEKLLTEHVNQSKALSLQIADLDHQNHEVTKEKQRQLKKSEELRKELDETRIQYNSYQKAINQNIAESNSLRKEINRLTDAEERISIRYEEVANLLNIIRREKELIEAEKITADRENDHLKNRLMEMQQIERSLVIENENLRTFGRRL